jgi:hypothetical protein
LSRQQECDFQQFLLACAPDCEIVAVDEESERELRAARKEIEERFDRVKAWRQSFARGS